MKHLCQSKARKQFEVGAKANKLLDKTVILILNFTGYEFGGFSGHSSILHFLRIRKLGGFAYFGQSRQNHAIGQSDEDIANIQISPTFCWIAKSTLHTQAGKTSLKHHLKMKS